MDDQSTRRYRPEDLNDLLCQLRTPLEGHDTSVCLLVSMALLMELLHVGATVSASSEWTFVVPVLQREILRGTAQVLNGGRVMAVDEGSEMVH